MDVALGDWQTARVELRTLANSDNDVGQLVECLQALWSRAPREKRECMRVAKLEYPFGSNLIKEGVALGPDGEDLISALRVANGLPFGVITTNSCEVAEAVLSSQRELYTPQALLYPGQLIGAFELLDRITPAAGPKYPDWTITAGARSMHFLQVPDGETAYDDIRRYYRTRVKGAPDIPVYNQTEIQSCDSFHLLKRISPAWLEACKWKATVLYFSPEWAAELEDQLAQDRPGPAALNLRHFLLVVGWRAEARVRAGSGILYDVLAAWGGQATAAEYDAAYQIVEKCRQIFEGRRPCFAPTESTDCRGPWNEISDGVLRPAKYDPRMMVPKYLEPGETGFLPLAHIVPGVFGEKNLLRRLERVLDVIRGAQGEVVRRKRRVPALQADDLFPHLAFRLRAAGKDGVKAYQASGSNLREIPFTDFYRECFPSTETHPLPGCEFFRVAVRIHRPASGAALNGEVDTYTTLAERRPL